MFSVSPSHLYSSPAITFFFLPRQPYDFTFLVEHSLFNPDFYIRRALAFLPPRVGAWLNLCVRIGFYVAEAGKLCTLLQFSGLTFRTTYSELRRDLRFFVTPWPSSYNFEQFKQFSTLVSVYTTLVFPLSPFFSTPPPPPQRDPGQVSAPALFRGRRRTICHF